MEKSSSTCTSLVYFPEPGEMEGHSALCCSTEMIESIVKKLTEVMRTSPIDLQQDLKGLKKDLKEISFSRTTNLITGEQAKVWVKQVKELLHDFEDWQLESKEGTSSSFGEPERSWQISKLTALVMGARERYRRYELHKKASTDPHLLDARHREATRSSKPEGTADSSLLWGQRAVLVGTDAPKTELIPNLLKDKATLRVVCILGVGGIGKTTLAKVIYEDLKRQFDCKASVFLGPNPSLKEILLDILHQVKRTKYHVENHGHVREVIVQICEFLRDKRYVILIDDIRSASVWKVISCAFPENGHGRILVTTRFNDVAELCSMCPNDIVYEMKALSLENSKELLENIIAIPKNKRPTDFEEVTDRVLKLCCGIPLAIIVTSGLLCWNWNLHGKSNFPPLVKTYSVSELMRKVLDISFADLSSLHVKYCLLFFSSFPVNYTINKDHLIRRWVTEELVKKGNGIGLQETGESYFNELIHRRLVEPVFDYSDDQAVGCTVHAVVYDFISSIAREGNFVTDASELVRGPFPRDTIRRYSVHYIGQKDEADTLVTSTMHLARVRYLAVFGEGRLPYDSLSAIKLLRVLDLRDTNSFTAEAAKIIRLLSLLKYLALGGLTGSSTSKSAPVQIDIEGLNFLETLDVSRIPTASFPYNYESHTSIYTLPKLVSIIADTVQLPRSVPPKDIYTSLKWKEAATISIETRDQYNVVVELLVKSRWLRKLGVSDGSYFKSFPRKIGPFFTELRECKAKSLLLDFDRLPKGWTPSPNLRKFVLKKSISSVPETWTSLVNLTHMDIQISVVGEQDVYYIGKLPKLMFLKLCSEGYDPKDRLSIYGGFQSLKVAWFKCPDGGMGLQFRDRNTMPELRRLRLDFNERKTRVLYGRSFDFGLRFPSHLIEVHVTINCNGSTHGDVSDAESAIKEQLCDHNNKPRFQVRRKQETPSDNTAAGTSSSEGTTSSKQIFASWAPWR